MKMNFREYFGVKKALGKITASTTPEGFPKKMMVCIWWRLEQPGVLWRPFAKSFVSIQANTVLI